MAVYNSLLRTYIAAAIASLSSVTSGSMMGWMSPTQPFLEGDDSFIKITTEESSWVGSLCALGAAIGPLASGYLADTVGRKWTLLGLSVPFLVGWLLAGLAEPLTSLEMIYTARVLQGMAMGVVFAVLPMYSGEIAEDSIRGALGSFLQLFITVGFIYEYSIGPYVPYWVLVVVTALFPVLLGVGMFFMPDSPYFLLAKGRKVEAHRALEWLRGTGDVDDEMMQMQEAIDEAQRNKGSMRDLIATRGNIKALYLSMGLVAFQQLSGINAVLFYSQNIFSMTGSSLSASTATIIMGVVMFLSSAAAPLMVDRLGRRPLLLTSAGGMAVGHAILGTYFYMRDQDESSVENIGFLPILSMVLYIIVYSYGFGALPWAVMGELFPSNVKGNASSITASFCWLLAFFITKFFSNLVDGIGTHYTFWIFGIFCIVAGVFVFFLLPETKGKSLQEIQDDLNR